MSAASEVTKALGAIDIAAAIDSLPAASRKRLLAEFKALSKLHHTSFVALDQCRRGGLTTKTTWLLHSRIDLSKLALRCNHPYVSRQKDKGEKYRAPHVRVQ